jgi:serine/threonine protein kinase
LVELLTGILPVYSKAGQLVSFNLENRGRITSSSYLGVLGDLSRSFVLQLLNPNPALRPSAAEALAHPWLDLEVKQGIDSLVSSTLDAAGDY